MSVWESVSVFLLCCLASLSLVFAFESLDREKSVKEQNKIMQQKLEMLQKIEQKLDSTN